MIYLERTEKVPPGIGDIPDFCRSFYDPATEGEDKAALVALIPDGITVKHYCYHPENEACKVEVLL